MGKVKRELSHKERHTKKSTKKKIENGKKDEVNSQRPKVTTAAGRKEAERPNKGEAKAKSLHTGRRRKERRRSRNA